MFDYKKVFPIFFSLCCVPAINAVVAEVEVLSDGVHYRYFIKDIHVDYINGQNTFKQREDIIWAVKQKFPNAFIIVEDPSDCTSKNQKVRAFFNTLPKNFELELADLQKRLSEGCYATNNPIETISVPDKLVADCIREQIPYYNPECNFILAAFENTRGMPDGVTEREVIDELKELYRECGCEGKEEMWVTLAEIAAHPQKNMYHFIPCIEDLRSILVDARTVLKLTEWKDITYGFICEGATHTDGNVKKVLLQSGYRHVKTIGIPVLEKLEKLGQGENYEDICKHIVEHALDLRKTFTQIFSEQQQLVTPVSFWARHKASLATGAAAAIVLGCVALRYLCK